MSPWKLPSSNVKLAEDLICIHGGARVVCAEGPAQGVGGGWVGDARAAAHAAAVGRVWARVVGVAHALPCLHVEHARTRGWVQPHARVGHVWGWRAPIDTNGDGSDVVGHQQRHQGAGGAWHVTQGHCGGAGHTQLIRQVKGQLELHRDHFCVVCVLVFRVKSCSVPGNVTPLHCITKGLHSSWLRTH